MMYTLYTFLQNRVKYVNCWTILFLDTVLSALASFITLLFVASFVFNIADRYILIFFLYSFFASAFSFYFFRVNRDIIRHATIRSIVRIGMAILLKGILLVLIAFFFYSRVSLGLILVCCVLDLLATACVVVGVRVFLVLVYELAIDKMQVRKIRILVYGTTEKSVALKKRMYLSKHYHVIGFINPDSKLKFYTISELPVYYFLDEENFARFVRKYNIRGILFALQEDVQQESEKLIAYSQNNNVKIFLAPSVNELGKEAKKTTIREIRIEDLLGREEININLGEVKFYFSGKEVMVTGAAGSIGSELCRQLASFGVKHLVLFDNAETPMHELRLELEKTYPHLVFTPFIGDVRQLERLRSAFEKFHPQVVFHAAAYKHVPLMEENPCEAVRVNVVGTRILADLCVEYGVEKMVMVSTDKAVNPTNVMGASKRLAEIYVQSLGLAIERGEIKGTTRFVTTRFGNVLGSNGSVIPHFRKQIATGGPVTVTDPRITRYFMTIPEACRLVMEAAVMKLENRIFVFDMGEPVRIVDLAERMIRLAGYIPNEDIKIKFIGLRPGEKLYEEVLSNEENTQPTDNEKIRIAKVRSYSHVEILPVYDRLADLALNVQLEETVRCMKQIVPEFKSNNSIYEKLDSPSR